jgi:excisionase family DNA binding protein
MGAYDTPRLRLAAQRSTSSEIKQADGLGVSASGSVLDVVIDQLAERVAQRLAVLIDRGSTTEDSGDDEWFDSRHAADYLGIHRDTLRKLAAERAIPSEQDAPNCKLYFRRGDLDAWRLAGGRPRHLATTLSHAA